MSELSPKARALLEAARRDHNPEERDRSRILAGLHATLGIGSVLPFVDPSPASAGVSGPQVAQPGPDAMPSPAPGVDAISGPQLPAPPASMPSTASPGSAWPGSALPGGLTGSALPGLKPASSLGWSKLLAWKAGKVWLASLVIGGGAVGASMLPRSEPSDSMSARRSAAYVAPSAVEVAAGNALDTAGDVNEGAATEAMANPRAEDTLKRAGDAPELVAHELPTAARASEGPANAALHARAMASRADEAGQRADTLGSRANTVGSHAMESASEAAHARGLSRSVRTSEASAVREAAGSRSSAQGVAKQDRREHRRARRRAREEAELLAQPAVAPAKVEAEPVQEPLVALSTPPSPELALIRAAVASLRDREAMQALRLLDEHAARYPRGAFLTERRALHAVALCAAGRTEEGMQERAQFLKSAGDSPIAARVRSACSGAR